MAVEVWLVRALVDTTFDFRTDANGGDPDLTSSTFRRYHRALWSKSLPSGAMFALDEAVPGAYLHHGSHRGEFFFSSDTMMPTFAKRASSKPVLGQIPEEEHEGFETARYTIGGMIVFPSNKIDGKLTINGARGFDPRIADRFDLTLECIRRHYAGQPNPLEITLNRYAAFFALFDDFSGYVEFFLLQDLTTAGGKAVRFLRPFDDFASSPIPADVDTYLEFRRRSIDFIDSRNQRIGRERVAVEPAGSL